MWFRILFAITTVCLWLLTFWLASHNSENSDVLSRYSSKYFGFLVAIIIVSIVSTVFQFGSAHKWIYGKRHNLTLLVLSLVFSFGCVELSIRMLDPIGISYYKHALDYHFDKIADDEMYYRHRPNLERSYQGVSVHMNELGFRDNPIAKKESDELRIMFLGDSVTFGWGVEQEDIFVRRVGEILEETLRRPVRTINTSVGSYNTDNQHAVMSHYGPTLDPDLVILTYVSNDIEPTPVGSFNPRSQYTFSGKSPPEVIQLLASKTWSYRLVSHIVRFREGSPSTGLYKSSDGWKQSVNALQGIADYCHSRDIPFIVIMYRMVPNRLEDDIARELDLLSGKMSFYFGDTLTWFRGRDVRLLTNTLVDSHPNAQGHAVLAEGMVNLITQKVFSSRDTRQ